MNLIDDVDALTVLYYRFARRSWAHLPLAMVAALAIAAAFYWSLGDLNDESGATTLTIFIFVAALLLVIGLMQLGIASREMSRKQRQLDKALAEARKLATDVKDSAEKDYRALELAIVSAEAFRDLHGDRFRDILSDSGPNSSG